MPVAASSQFCQGISITDEISAFARSVFFASRVAVVFMILMVSLDDSVGKENISTCRQNAAYFLSTRQGYMGHC